MEPEELFTAQNFEDMHDYHLWCDAHILEEDISTNIPGCFECVSYHTDEITRFDILRADCEFTKSVFRLKKLIADLQQ